MALSVATLATSRRFAEAMAVMAGQLGGLFDETPRLARALVSHQRWMMTQAAFALFADHATGRCTGAGLTASTLANWICGMGIASRNTVLTYVDQMLSYRFVRLHPQSRKRPRSFELVETSVMAMQHWFAANLASLDYVDDGCRRAQYLQHPELLLLVQPEFARQCIDDDAWREPDERIGLFQWTESGALVMDRFVELTMRAPLSEGFYDLGIVDIPAMAERFVMSRTHLQRALKRAEEHGCIRRTGQGRTSRIYLAAAFLGDYLAWLARKAAILDAVFERELALIVSCEQTELDAPRLAVDCPAYCIIP